MNARKLKQLFDAARKETPPSAPEGFERSVMQALGREGRSTSRATGSMLDQLTQLFPRLAFASVLIIFACVAGELVLSATTPSLSDGVAELSDQWLFAADGESGL